MKEAGLTHGGFYGHFASKEELATEAITRAFAQGSEKLGHCSDLGGLVNAYLSDAHCADRSEGCALAALSADIARVIDRSPVCCGRAPGPMLVELRCRSGGSIRHPALCYARLRFAARPCAVHDATGPGLTPCCAARA
jgi:hypothetical protein